MKQTLTNFYNDVAKRKSYWMPILFFAVLAYGFSLFNRTVSIDDLAMETYIGDGHAMIAATRWGMVLWVKLFSIPVFMPFARRFLAVAFMICGATVLSCVVYSLMKLKHVWIYTIFAVTIVVFPLINEIFEFDGANMVVGGNLLLAALTILFLVIFESAPWWKKVLIPAMLLTPVVSSYEAGAFVYVTTVFILLFCKYVIVENANKPTAYLREGISYAVPLLLAVVLRIVIGLVLIKLYGLEYAPNGDSTIVWSQGWKTVFEAFLKTGNFYFIFAFWYLPITIFAIAFIVFIAIVITLSIQQHRISPLIYGGGVLFSLFLLVLIQGQSLQYRTAQNITIFVAFVLAFALESCLNSKRRGIQYAALIGSLWLCLQQSTYLNQVLALNNQRSDNEIAVVQQIGYRLKSSFEDKPVVFIGIYDIGSWMVQQITVDSSNIVGRIYYSLINEISPRFSSVPEGTFLLTKHPRTNVGSLLGWSSGALFGNKNMMKEYFSYCGYDINTMDFKNGKSPDGLSREDYTAIAKQENMKPFEIRDMGDYILVCLGELENTDTSEND